MRGSRLAGRIRMHLLGFFVGVSEWGRKTKDERRRKWDERSDTVRGGCIQRITNDDTGTDRDDIDVERMVDEVHVGKCWERT